MSGSEEFEGWWGNQNSSRRILRSKPTASEPVVSSSLSGGHRPHATGIRVFGAGIVALGSGAYRLMSL